MKSWKTTLGGIILALAPVSKQLLTPDYHWVSEALLALGGLIVGVAARDNGVSSENAGVK
jgi:hypothetical protein